MVEQVKVEAIHTTQRKSKLETRGRSCLRNRALAEMSHLQGQVGDSGAEI